MVVPPTEYLGVVKEAKRPWRLSRRQFLPAFAGAVLSMLTLTTSNRNREADPEAWKLVTKWWMDDPLALLREKQNLIHFNQLWLRPGWNRMWVPGNNIPTPAYLQALSDVYHRDYIESPVAIRRDKEVLLVSGDRLDQAIELVPDWMTVNRDDEVQWGTKEDYDRLQAGLAKDRKVELTTLRSWETAAGELKAEVAKYTHLRFGLHIEAATYVWNQEQGWMLVGPEGAIPPSR